MAKIIIGNDYIHFHFNSETYSANIARFIEGEQVTFIVRSTCLDTDTDTIFNIKRVLQQENKGFCWVDAENKCSSDFISRLGAEIEKNASLLSEETA